MGIDLAKFMGDELALINEAMKVYGLSSEHVFGFRVDREKKEVSLLMVGGKKVTHRQGNPSLCELSEVEKTGVLPEQEMVWDPRYNQRRPRD